MVNNHKLHNFEIANIDTDSISFFKLNYDPFTKEEKDALEKEINNLTNEFMVWEDDGYYTKFIVLKAKNYITLRDDGKITLKGSSLKSSSLEPAFKSFLREIIDSLLYDRKDFVEIYKKYVKMASQITDIKPWCSKKTLSERTYNSERANETKILTAIEDTDYAEGDKVYVFYDENDNLILAENFKGVYDKDRMYEKLYKATSRFWTILDKNQFINYKLKRNKEKLKEIL